MKEHVPVSKLEGGTVLSGARESLPFHIVYLDFRTLPFRVLRSR